MNSKTSQTSEIEILAKIINRVQSLRILSGKRYPKIKLKNMNMDNQLVSSLNRLFVTGSYIEIKSQKYQVLSDKNLFFVIVLLCTFYCISLILGFIRAVLYGNIAFSIALHSAKKPYLRFFLKKASFSRKPISKLKRCKRSKSPTIVA